MARNPKYDILFEPVRIGPVTAPNRFYQTPHATGMGYMRPQSAAALRGIKAEGGWGVVNTEYCSIHPSSDDSPHAFVSLWDDDDVRSLARTAEAVHRHGSLAGVELWHGGSQSNNRLTREPMLAPSDRPAHYIQPLGARGMDKDDIRNLRNWQRQAAVRARQAGFDIVYVYAGHGYLPFQFLSPRINRRTDEYGGSLENRVRLLKEMILDTKDAVGATCAVAVRLAVEEMHGPDGITHDGEGREIIALLAELPDLWDVNVAGTLGDDSKSSRFSSEGFQEDYVAFVKTHTSKPVVGVGRFTSPDTMVSQIRRGVLDLIGAARPSIADPFLPLKIDEGREDEIRECIGCNICRAANNEAVPLRCTQNPTIGEEWRRGWHPEQVAEASRKDRVLIVGGGPAGLECALTLGRRGIPVMLAEARRELGGRVGREASLAGLNQWSRVRDHREHMLGKLPQVEIFRESRMTPEDILAIGAPHIVVATGSRWRRDGIGALQETEVAVARDASPLTPDDYFAGAKLGAAILVFDDDHYAMGGALAETLTRAGHRVTLVTTMPVVSSWTAMTDEQFFIQRRLIEFGVRLVVSHELTAIEAGRARLACIYSGRERSESFDDIVLVTGRVPDAELYGALLADRAGLDIAGIVSVDRIGDCLVPSSIADAVFGGHRHARQFGETPEAGPVRRERPL